MKHTKQIKTIFEKVYIETTVDTDGDGKYDLIAAWITRPEATMTGDLKVPAVFVANPYLMTCNESWYNLHNVDVPLKAYGNQEISICEIKEKYIDTPIYQAKSLEKSSETKTAITDEKPVFEAVSPLYEYLANKGYAIIFSGGLGTLGSDGFTMTGSREEVLAFKAVIDWLCNRARAFTDREHGIEIKADWCNGKVAMSSKSYLGTMQYAVAATGVEGLEAIIPEAGISNWYDYYRTNGLCVCPYEWQGDDCDLLSLYCMSRAKDNDDWESVKDQYKTFIEKYITLEDRDTGNYNSFWDERNYLAHAEKYKVPTLIIHGLNDWNVKTDQAINAFQFLEERGIERKLILHQGEHIYVYDLKDSPVLEIIEKWLSHYLKNENNGICETSKVMVQSNSIQEQWYESNEWPPEGVNYIDFPIDNLSNRITIIDDLNDTVFDREKKNLSEWKDELVLDAEKRNKFIAVWNPWNGETENRDFVRIAGSVKVKFAASLNKPTAILSAMLVDLGKQRRLNNEQVLLDDPENSDLFEFGTEQTPSSYRVITRGWLNAENYDNIWSKRKIIPGENYEFSFEMVPTDYTMLKGSELALIIYGIDAEFTVRPDTVTEISIDSSTIDVKIPMIVK